MAEEKEAGARIAINKLLEDAGWRFKDSPEGKANIKLEEKVNLPVNIPAENASPQKGDKSQNLGDDSEDAQKGYIDYLLLDEKNFPLCVIEAKRESTHPLSAKEQARNYARGKGWTCKFAILSNGNLHYFWNIDEGDPELITKFPNQASLQRKADHQTHTIDLALEEVDANYLGDKQTLRDYQVEAVVAVKNAAKSGKKRYLLEMATGTGKTTVSAAICKLFLKTGHAQRILFLVDRIELENQALKSLRGLFESKYHIEKFKDGNWEDGQIVISTVQSLLAGNRYREEFSPIDFDLVISDEAHRSLGRNSRAVFEYFLGYKLGLTATPKDYLKGIDEEELEKKNLKALEERKHRDTYKTFGCEDGNPTYRYDLNKGVTDGVLISPFVIDARTEISTQLLSEKGYAIQIDPDDESSDEAIFGARDFERKFFNEDTNRVFCETILENGLLDPHTKEFGKMLVFCVSRNHAAKITNQLNACARAKWPGKYESDFAIQVTSGVGKEQQSTKDFGNNRLGGKSQFGDGTHPGYETSKARVCVTVGMMTTGYDCPDLLNIAMLRPIFSPSDFIQMKGRGTRKHTFEYQETDATEEKEGFLLLDFFGNYEYFEKDFEYDKQLKLSTTGTASPGLTKDPTEFVAPQKQGAVDANVPDKIATEATIQIGEEGMKIDKALHPHEQFERILQESQTLQNIEKEQDIDGLEEFIKTDVFNQPTEYWTAEKIRQSYEKHHKTDRKIRLEEMILKALGYQKGFKSREERLDEEFQKFIDIQKPQIAEDENEKARILKEFFETYISDERFRDIIDSGRFAETATYPTLGTRELTILNSLITDVTTYVEEYLQRETEEFAWGNEVK